MRGAAPLTRRAVLAGLALALGLSFACSNDAELPTNYHEDLLAQPTATAEAAGGDIAVAWEMSSLDNVDSYVVGFADSSGAETTRAIADPQAVSYRESGLNLAAGALWVVRVWAVDDRGFYGPASDPDSLRIP